MNNLRAIRTLVVLVCILSAPVVRAQRIETKVENAEVVYVEGNDVVMKFNDGEVRHFEIPESYMFTVDGKVITVHELKPGMKLSTTITTTTAPRWVDTVAIVDVGTVWKTVGNTLIVKPPVGQNKMYRMPSGSKVTVDGKERTIDQLREGDKITATVIKTRGPVEVGKAAALVLKGPATPAQVGVLLIDEGATPPAEPAGMWGNPATTVILIIVLLLVAVLILLAVRRKRKTS